jgi:hypothetical protein
VKCRSYRTIADSRSIAWSSSRVTSDQSVSEMTSRGGRICRSSTDTSMDSCPPLLCRPGWRCRSTGKWPVMAELRANHDTRRRETGTTRARSLPVSRVRRHSRRSKR